MSSRNGSLIYAIRSLGGGSCSSDQAYTLQKMALWSWEEDETMRFITVLRTFSRFSVGFRCDNALKR